MKSSHSDIESLARTVAPKLWAVKISARAALGLVWVIEGAVPKIFFVSPGEIELVRASSLYFHTPERTLALIGVAEIIAGLWVLSGLWERAAVLSVTIAMCGLVAVVVATDARMLVNPLGGISKNLCLFACAIVVWRLAPLAPTRAQSR
ncbi:MAG: DoxX-like family protein [Acidobacteriota bacterium]